MSEQENKEKVRTSDSGHNESPMTQVKTTSVPTIVQFSEKKNKNDKKEGL